MKKLFIFLLIAVGLICCHSAQTASVVTNNYFYGFENSIPSEFSFGGNGVFSYRLNSSVVSKGANSLEITTQRGYGPNYAWARLDLNETIRSVSFSIYDQYAGNAPFYMYFGSDLNILAWQDAALSDNVLIYGGGSAVPTLRTIGWHNVEAVFSDKTITYNYDNSLLGTWTSPNSLNVTSIGWTVDSAWSGTYSMYIDNVSVYTAVPEPSTYALFGIGAIGMLMVMRRKKTA